MSALLLVGGCAGTPVGQTTTMPTMLDGMRVITAPVPATVDEGLDADTLYKLLVAEIAGQRDQLDLAVENYLEIARASRDPAVIERAIRIAVYARDDAAAAEIAELWLQVDPGNPDAHQVLAAVAIHNDDVESAVNHLENILGSDSSTSGHKLWLIAIMLSRENHQETTLAVMKRLVAGDENNPDLLFAYANLAEQANDLDLAERLLERLLKLQPQNPNVVMNYVTVLRDNGKQEQSLDWLRQHVEHYPDDFNLRLMYARLLTDARHFDAARAEFEALLQQTPDNVDLLYALGLLALQSNQLQDAKARFEHLLELGAHESEAHYYLGRIAEQDGDLDAAVTYYAAVGRGENHFDARIRSALIHQQQGSVSAALAQLKSIPADNENEQVLLAQAEAEILSREQRYEEAMAVYNEALETHPGNTDLLYGRAMLAEKMDNLEQLERDLRAIIEQNPDHVQALNALGYTLADRTDRLQEAHDLIEQALKLGPDNFYIIDSMGWVLYRMGRLDEAEEYLRRAFELQHDPEVAAHLGEVLWVKGDREAAREIWDAALQSTPDHEGLLDVIERFNP